MPAWVGTAGVGRHRRRAAGATWSLAAAITPWAARFGHTTVIDAAGTMYLIGGYNGNYFNDVWSSANKGANRTRGGTQGSTHEGTLVILRG